MQLRHAPLGGALLGCALAALACAPHRAALLSAAPSIASAPTPGRTVGIPPFTVAALSDTTLAPLGFALADLLTTDLARSRQITLVERARLAEVLRELDLAAAGAVDSATAPRVGRLVQAQQLVVGSVAVAGASARELRLGVHLSDVRTGTVDGAIDTRAPLAEILTAEKALAYRIFDALHVTLAPSERAAVEQRPTGNLAALLAYGNGVRREYIGDYRGAADEYRRAARLDPEFHAARSRVVSARALGESGISAPVIIPGLRTTNAVVGVTVDRINRPLDPISTFAPSARAADPAFPATAATVIVTVTRP